MLARTSLAGVLTAALAGTTLALSAGTAFAATDPDDTTFTPTTSDVIGVGSDTSQRALFLAANAYNAQSPAPANKLATFAATGGGTITLPSGAINRPNGSGAGKALLYGAGDNTDIDFARSSSALSTAEVGAGLQAFPFALDTLKMAVSNSVPSNAPASLTPAQIVSIYKGDVTNWSQVGGTAGVIAPKIPQAGSGTRSFFLAQLKAANGGVDVALAGSVAEVQEHDDATIKNDANAVAPFSVGRAKLLGTTLRLEGGFSADRALYDVVRGADIGNADVTKLFASTGFLCSDAATSLVAQAGFEQLARPEDDGVCGAATQGATTDFTTNDGPSAAGDSDDTTFTPKASDLIGVGSDTSQRALFLAANAYNAQSPAPANKLATFAATGGGTITLPSGAINRPNGSGAGKALLYGAGDNTDIDFARSSSALSTAEVGAGLQAFPFALDTLKMAVSNSVPSNAPASLTPAQIVSIYKGDVTNWSQVGGTAGVIAPKIPQAGSGTRSFFLAQLKAANGGVDVALAGSVAEVQEHDDATIKNDANAVAPFSVGRAKLLGTTLRLEGGFSADRALYDVVRGADIGNADVQKVFASAGFLCSDAATSLVAQAGFEQLARPEDDGVCGAATQGATTDFTTNDGATDPTDPTDPGASATTTSVSVSSPSPRKVRIVAVVSGTPTPTGAVTFVENGGSVGTAQLVNGTATLFLGSVKPGRHSYGAVYTPSDSGAYTPSQGAGATSVKTTSKTSVRFSSRVKAGSKPKGRISVALVGTSSKASGRIMVKRGTTTVGSGKLRGGVATVKLTKLKAGKNKLKAIWSGNALSSGSAQGFQVTVVKKRK